MSIIGFNLLSGHVERRVRCRGEKPHIVVIPDLIRNPGYMQTKLFYIYILANDRNGTIYIGVTSDLEKRIKQHKTKMYEQSFTAKYSIDKLVYYESTENSESAIAREKQLKNWTRQWKLDLIEKNNPQWKDLSENW